MIGTETLGTSHPPRVYVRTIDLDTEDMPSPQRALSPSVEFGPRVSRQLETPRPLDYDMEEEESGYHLHQVDGAS